MCQISPSKSLRPTRARVHQGRISFGARLAHLITAVLSTCVFSMALLNYSLVSDQGSRMMAPEKYTTDTPPVSDNKPGKSRKTTATTTINNFEPSYLQWNASPVKVPEVWSFQTPEYCDENTTNNLLNDTPPHDGQKIIVHFHLQHNAGTNFYYFAWKYTPCSTQACLQTSKHCLVSNNEEVEADNIRHNYKKYGVQYVSYELMLPPRFPLPFVSDSARRGLFFTTIVRNPWERYLTFLRRQTNNGENQRKTHSSSFWTDLQDKRDVYAADNLNVRWLSGAIGPTITRDNVNIAKCRLQLFDLVIVDKLYDFALKKVICPLNNWKGEGIKATDDDDFWEPPINCDGVITEREMEQKPDPLNGTDLLFLGTLVKHLRPSTQL